MEVLHYRGASLNSQIKWHDFQSIITGVCEDVNFMVKWELIRLSFWLNALKCMHWAHWRLHLLTKQTGLSGQFVRHGKLHLSPRRWLLSYNSWGSLRTQSQGVRSHRAYSQGWALP